MLSDDTKLNADEKRKTTGGIMACGVPGTTHCWCFYQGRWHEYCCTPEGGCEAGIPEI